MDQRGAVWFLSGFLSLALGNAVGAVYMFRGNVLAVMVGVFLMVGGFQSMHYGSHGTGMVDVQSLVESDGNSQATLKTWALTVVFLSLSIFFIAQGFVIGSQAALQSFTIVDMALCGGSIVGGYITGHIGIHGLEAPL